MLLIAFSDIKDLSFYDGNVAYFYSRIFLESATVESIEF
jgi:hypothetical protein